MSDRSTKKQYPSKSLFRRIVLWLAVVVAVLSLLLIAAGLLAERFLNNPDIKGKIEQKAAAAFGVALEFQQIGIGYYPLPVIEVQGLTFALPEYVHGAVGSVRIVPDLAGLFSGRLPAGRITLERPDISITLQNLTTADQSTKAAKQEIHIPISLAGISIAGSELVVSDGRFTVLSGDRKLEAEGVALTLQVSLDGVRKATVDLTTTLARLTMENDSRHQRLEKIVLTGSGTIADGSMAVRLEELTVDRPALGLSGNLDKTDKGVQLDLVGNNIDVDATRAAALGIAGTITPIAEIFTYLTGGTIPQIRFAAEGTTFADLGAYANFHLDGQLRAGKVSVPEIGLDLSEVEGDVHLLDGVLRGDKLSARLGKSTGDSGTLALGLAEESDLFQLELMVKADLAEGKAIVKRLVDTPRIAGELERITLLEGTGVGKLILGDSFSDLGVKVEAADLQLTFSHAALPFPVKISGGQVDFANDSLTLRELQGTFGSSTFSGIAGMLDWQKGLELDIGMETSQLVLDELFPWLQKMEGVKSHLTSLTSATGKVNLNVAHFKGAIDRSGTWKYGAAGEMADVLAATPVVPGKIAIQRSTFTVDEGNIALQKTKVIALDGDLQLQGTLRDWSAVDLGVDGTLGAESVAWLERTLSVPEKYALRPPVSLAGARLIWIKNGERRLSGNVTFGSGPVLTLALNQGEKGVNVEQLRVKGIGTDLAELKVVSNENGTDTAFSGKLGHETLEALFVHAGAGKGLLEGDIGVKIPRLENGTPTAQGRLNGSELLLPLAGDNTLRIGSITLQGEGSGFRAEIGDLLWRTFLFNTVKGTVDVHHDKVTTAVDTAELCGIPAAGKGSFGDDLVDIAVSLNGKNLDVAKTYTCLTQGDVEMSGSMAVVGEISTQGRPEKLFISLEGPLEMRFANGVIKRGRAFASILEALSVTQVVRGRLPNLSADGFAYRTIELQGRFGNGKYTIDTILMDGETLDLVGNGSIDLQQGTVKVELLAAPFTTVDSVIKYIPGINYVMGDRLMAIPLSITGSLENPKVVVMSASAVSRSLLQLGARTLNLPLKLLQSILPGSE